MPEVLVTHETSKTVIKNLEQVSKALSRNPGHIIKFLSMDFGCTCTTGQKYALNGSFDENRIQAGIYDFIDAFVLCKACGNPETRFLNETPLKRGCNSCGAEFVQESHKLNSLIAKDRSANEDTKYEASNKTNLQVLLKEDTDNSQRIYEIFQRETWSLENIFTDYIRAKDLKKLSLVLKQFKVNKILENIENMLESKKKEDKAEGFLEVLLELGFSRDELVEYLSSPRVGKKRSPLLKKIFDVFCEEE
ncbi:eukaryotic translation initiation factor 5 [Glugoides intestinalis]